MAPSGQKKNRATISEEDKACKPHPLELTAGLDGWFLQKPGIAIIGRVNHITQELVPQQFNTGKALTGDTHMPSLQTLYASTKGPPDASLSCLCADAAVLTRRAGLGNCSSQITCLFGLLSSDWDQSSQVNHLWLPLIEVTQSTTRMVFPTVIL